MMLNKAQIDALEQLLSQQNDSPGAYLALRGALVGAAPTLLALSRAALEVEGELRSLAADFDEENKEGPMGLPADFLRAQADKITAAAGGAK